MRTDPFTFMTDHFKSPQCSKERILAKQEAEQKLAAAVAQLLADAERVDEAEDELYGTGKRGDELPEEFRESKSRLERI